jgi:H+/Cl- antiporter ClcA/CBS domain-containing protein
MTSTGTIPHRRLFALCGLAAVLGLAGGAAAWALLHLVRGLTNLALLHTWSWADADLGTMDRTPWVVLAAVAGSGVVALLARWAPVIRGHGIPEAMEAVLTKQSRIAPRTAVAKPLSAAVAIGTGGPFGAEGPIIVTGGALGSMIGQVLPVSPAERKTLLAAGAAAGMAATFGAPVAAVALAVELLLFELSARSLLPLVVAASVAGATHGALISDGPVFPLPAVGSIGLGALPWFAALGLAAGLVAAGVCRGFFAVEDAYRRLPIPSAWHPVVGALVWASLGLIDPRVLGIGFGTVREVLTGNLAAWTLLGLCLLKLVVWWLALGSGTSGGTLAPLLLIGGAFGGFVGAVAEPLLPGELGPAPFAVAGMAAVFGASTRASFTAAIFLVELTGEIHLALPLLLACALADLVARGLLRESLMTEKLARRGLRVGLGYRVDALDTATVAQVMTRDVVTVPASAGVGDARRAARRSGHSAFPVVSGGGPRPGAGSVGNSTVGDSTVGDSTVDGSPAGGSGVAGNGAGGPGPGGGLGGALGGLGGGRPLVVGLVGRSELFTDVPDDQPVTSVASSDVVTVRPDATALEALGLMLEEGVDHLPVLEGGRLAGICTRTDLLSVRRRHFDEERRQPGWRPRLLR